MADEERDETLLQRKERIRASMEAVVTGHIDAILGRQSELDKFSDERLERLTSVLGATRAGNGCCTGG